MQAFSLSAQFARESAMLKLPEERRRWGESKEAGRGRGERREKFFFLPFPSLLSFFRSRTYRKDYYFYSPQSSTVIKSKMVATTILRTRTRFRPPKIRLNCRLSMTWNAYYSNPIPGTKKSFEQWIVAIILFGFICLSKKHITRVLMTLNLAT